MGTWLNRYTLSRIGSRSEQFRPIAVTALHRSEPEYALGKHGPGDSAKRRPGADRVFQDCVRHGWRTQSPHGWVYGDPGIPCRQHRPERLPSPAKKGPSPKAGRNSYPSFPHGRLIRDETLPAPLQLSADRDRIGGLGRVEVGHRRWQALALAGGMGTYRFQ